MGSEMCIRDSYALNGTASQWDYNPKTQSLTAAANVSKVGIGTTSPMAALEVVSASGGDDAVKLPAGSVGAEELASNARSTGFTLSCSAQDSTPGVASRTIVAQAGQVLLFTLNGGLQGQQFWSGGFDCRVFVDGVSVGIINGIGFGGQYTGPQANSVVFGSGAIPLSAGTHTIELKATPTTGGTQGATLHAAFVVLSGVTPSP